jgi:cell division protein FtsL
MSEKIPPPPKKMVRRSVAVAIGIVCILLIAGLVGAMAYYTMAINNKDNSISSLNVQISSKDSQISQQNANLTNLQNQINQLQAWLAGNETLLNRAETWLDGNVTYFNSQISSLNSQIANLTNQLNSLVNGTETSLSIIVSNPSAWVNKTVTVEGTLSPVVFLSFEYAPWGYELGSGTQTFGVSISTSVNMSAFWNMFNFSGYARIYGVVEKGEITFTTGWGPPEVTYYIEAETVNPI